MPTIGELLERGFFPRELPPPFSTRAFAQYVVANLQQMPRAYWFGSGRPASPSPHNLSQAGSLRRRLGIPNPVAQTRMVCVVTTNFQQLDQHIRRSPLSKSAPAPVPSSGRALFPQHPHPELPIIRACTRSAKRYIIKGDLIRFYPSVYTHTIPWALHSKSVAKRQRGAALIGNQLDRALRDGQDGQTVGMPIGPDTSLVVAETILSSVDTELAKRFPRLVGHRHVDDYEIATSTYSEAEEALGHLQECLGQFELALNPRKTQIAELPQFLEAGWVAELRNFDLRSNPMAQAADLVRFADRAYGLASDFREESVLVYALARLKGLQLRAQNWELLEDLLLQAIVSEPKVIPLALDWLATASANRWRIDRNRVEDALSSVIIKNSPAGHGNEVAWALWACIFLSFNLSNEAGSILSRMSDSVVALLALDLDSKRPIAGLDKTHWAQFMTRDELWREHWLLSYEANVHGWLPSLGAADHVAAEPHFAFLKQAGIRFYDSTPPMPAVPGWTWTPPIPQASI